MINQFNKLTAGLCLCLSMTVNASSLFDGKNSDLWLIDEMTGAVTGYNYDQWLDSFSQAAMPLDASETAIVNNVINSSQPMTPSQPVLSLAGLEAGESDTSQSAQSNLLVEPASGTYTETINVQIMVDSGLIQAGGTILNWQIGVEPVQILPLEPALLTGATLKNGYYVHELTFVSDAELNVTIKDAGTDIVSPQARSYTIASTHPDGVRRDTDGDGLPDLVEIAIGLDALDSDWQHDSDGNGWSDFDEWIRSTDIDPVTGMPRDSDADGWSDFDEALRGTNPNDLHPTITPADDSELYHQAVKRFKDFPTARRLYEVESVIDGTLTATPAVADMTWSQVRADDINGQQYYDSTKLLIDSEIFNVGLNPLMLPGRTRQQIAGDALLSNQLPIIRVPVGDSMVITALHEKTPITQVYKFWLNRSADLTPLQFYQDQGAGSWNTAEEWKTAYINYLNGLVIARPIIVNLDQSTVAVALLEAFISHEARLYNNSYAGIQLFGNDASPINSALIKATEDALVDYVGVSSTLDDLIGTIEALVLNAEPLFELKNWVLQELNSPTDNVRTDKTVAEKFIKSFDESAFPCYIEQTYLDQISVQGAETEMAEFNAECPVYQVVADPQLSYAEQLQANYAIDQQRLYLLRLLLIPDGYVQYQLDQLAATPTLHEMTADTDSDIAINKEELFHPLIDITLPWLADRDGDGINDGLDVCPFDPENLCSLTPALPSLITTDSVTVHEPATGESFVLISFVLDKPSDNDVTVYYQTQVGLNGQTADASDFVEVINGQVIIDAGETVALVKVLINADANDEGAEEFTVGVTSVDNASLSMFSSTVVTINDPVVVPGGPPAVAAVPTLTFAPVKTFQFDWTDVADATYYRLMENTDGISGFIQVGNDIPQGTQTINHVVPLYARINAQYILQSCNDVDCTESVVVPVAGTMVDSIGYFKASNSSPGARFGSEIALSGDGMTMAVGAYSEDSTSTGINSIPNLDGTSAGAVYLFRLEGNNWVQQAYIKSSTNIGETELFGWSVALSADGNTLVAGAYGDDSTNTGINTPPDRTTTAQSSGAAFVFRFDGSNWSEQAYIKAPSIRWGDQFGYSVAISDDGNTLAVGANKEKSSTAGINSTPDTLAGEAGAVYLYRFDGSDWFNQAYIKASNTEASTYYNDWFGESVSLSENGNTLAVGANKEDSSTTGINAGQDNLTTDSGAVYLFRYDGSNWYEQAFIKSSNSGYKDEFGSSVSLSDDGDTLAVAAFNESSSTAGVNTVADDAAINSGAAYVFRFDGANWAEQAYIKASNSLLRDQFGTSIDLSGDGNALIVGAALEDSSGVGLNSVKDENALTSGAAYVFNFDGSNWSEQAYLKASNTEPGDEFGTSVSISGDGKKTAVGAVYEDSAATGVGADAADNSVSNAGAVYVY
ncbi:hypothetical protein ACFL3P_02495 [Pseudomonadota bacterium]